MGRNGLGSQVPPEAVLRNEQKLGSRVIDRAAADLVATFNIESILPRH